MKRSLLVRLGAGVFLILAIAPLRAAEREGRFDSDVSTRAATQPGQKVSPDLSIEPPSTSGHHESFDNNRLRQSSVAADAVALAQVLSSGATSGSNGSVNLVASLGQLVVGTEKTTGLHLGQGFWLSFGASFFTCCAGRVGDADYDGSDEPTIGDIAVIVDNLFISRQPLVCYSEADANQSGGRTVFQGDISIGDVSVLIDYLFITGPTLGLADCL